MPTLSVGSSARLLVVCVALAVFFGCDRYDYDRARRVGARAQIRSFKGALVNYKLDTGTYPTTKQGLIALVEKPSGVTQWNGPYLEKGLPKDPWGRDYIYKYPGKRGDEPDIISLGADGVPSGDDIDVAQTLVSAASRLLSTLFADSARIPVARAHYPSCKNSAAASPTKIRRANGSS
jgi:general secretion pathway protein G